MKVLILNSKDAGGGAAGIARIVADGYRSAGHDVHWLVGLKTRKDDTAVTEIRAPGDTGPLQTLGPRLFERLGGLRGSKHLARMRWRRLLQGVRPKSIAAQLTGREDFNLAGSSRLESLLPWKPDVIHAHNLHGFNHVTHFNLRLLPRLSAMAPFAVTLHDPWLLTGHCAHFIDCERWRTGCGHCPRLGIYPRLLRDGTSQNWHAKVDLYRRSKLHVVGVCDWITAAAKESILEHGLVSSRTIPNGVNLARFSPVSASGRAAQRHELGYAANAFLVVYASELGSRNPYRDFQAMRTAAADLARLLAPRPVVAVELGGDHAGIEVHDNLTIRALGFVPEKTVIQNLQCSDILLHAAIADTSPTIVYEAMACGLPVVATSVCGIPEQVEHGKNGLLVQGGAPNELTSALHQVAHDNGLRSAMSQAARDRMETHFDEKLMQRRYLALMDELTA